MSQTEKDLIEKLQQGDPQSLEVVVRLYTSHLYKACLGLGFRDFEAEDIAQSVWLTFFEAVVRFEARSSLRTFLFGILYNKASEYRKQNNRAVATENIEDVLDAYFDSRGRWIQSQSPVCPDRFLESSQNMSLISRCLELLPLNQKMAFILKEVEEKQPTEICRVLSVTPTNLGVLLFRARNQLRECIDRKSR